METLSIVVLCDKVAPFFVGGYEDRIYHLARELAERNQVSILSTLPFSEKEIDGVSFKGLCRPLLPEARSGRRNLANSLYFSIRLLSNPMTRPIPDVVLVEAIPYLHLAAMKHWARTLPSVKVLDVSEAWSAYRASKNRFLSGETRVVSHLLSIGIQWANEIVSISGATADSLRRNYGVSSVSVIPMGIDSRTIDRFSSVQKIDKSYDFVTVGRLVPIKRHVDFIAALARLKTTRAWNGKAAVIGAGPCSKSLMGEARRSGISDQVDFYGLVTDKLKFSILRASRVFVLCSEREGFSLATLEALYCGLPAVVAKPRFPEVFGVSELVTDGVTGSFFDVGDVGQMTDCMYWLASDEPRRALMGRAAHSKAMDFDWAPIASRFETLLRNSVAR